MFEDASAASNANGGYMDVPADGAAQPTPARWETCIIEPVPSQTCDNLACDVSYNTTHYTLHSTHGHAAAAAAAAIHVVIRALFPG